MRDDTYNPARRIIEKAVEAVRIDRSTFLPISDGFVVDAESSQPIYDGNGDVIGTEYTGFTELDSTETEAVTGN